MGISLRIVHIFRQCTTQNKSYQSKLLNTFHFKEASQDIASNSSGCCRNPHLTLPRFGHGRQEPLHSSSRSLIMDHGVNLQARQCFLTIMIVSGNNGSQLRQKLTRIGGRTPSIRIPCITFHYSTCVGLFLFSGRFGSCSSLFHLFSCLAFTPIVFTKIL